MCALPWHHPPTPHAECSSLCRVCEQFALPFIACTSHRTAHWSLPLPACCLQANCCFTAARRGHSSLVWLRPLLVLLLLVYVYAVYSGMVLYLAGSLFPPIYMRSLIWCDMMAAALTGLALVMEVSQVSRCFVFVGLGGSGCLCWGSGPLRAYSGGVGEGRGSFRGTGCLAGGEVGAHAAQDADRFLLPKQQHPDLVSNVGVS